MSIQIYKKISEDIISKINEGVYPIGAKLPSQRTLCKEYGVSASSIEKAILQMVRSGYIETRERSGNYVKGPNNDTYIINYDYASIDVKPEFTSRIHNEPILGSFIVDPSINSQQSLMISDISYCSKTPMIYRKRYIPFSGKNTKLLSSKKIAELFEVIRKDSSNSKMDISMIQLNKSIADECKGTEGNLYFYIRRFEYDEYRKIMCFTEVYAHNACFVMYGANKILNSIDI